MRHASLRRAGGTSRTTARYQQQHQHRRHYRRSAQRASKGQGPRAAMGSIRGEGGGLPPKSRSYYPRYSPQTPARRVVDNRPAVRLCSSTAIAAPRGGAGSAEAGRSSSRIPGSCPRGLSMPLLPRGVRGVTVSLLLLPVVLSVQSVIKCPQDTYFWGDNICVVHS
jgi:hypothetical protein